MNRTMYINGWETFEKVFARGLIEKGLDYTQTSEKLWEVNRRLGKPYRTPTTIRQNIGGRTSAINKRRLAIARALLIKKHPASKVSRDYRCSLSTCYRYRRIYKEMFYETK